MKAAISVDHCVSDGAEAAQFMQALVGFLEKPGRDAGVITTTPSLPRLGVLIHFYL